MKVFWLHEQPDGVSQPGSALPGRVTVADKASVTSDNCQYVKRLTGLSPVLCSPDQGFTAQTVGASGAAVEARTVVLPPLPLQVEIVQPGKHYKGGGLGGLPLYQRRSLTAI